MPARCWFRPLADGSRSTVLRQPARRNGALMGRSAGVVGPTLWQVGASRRRCSLANGRCRATTSAQRTISAVGVAAKFWCAVRARTDHSQPGAGSTASRPNAVGRPDRTIPCIPPRAVDVGRYAGGTAAWLRPTARNALAAPVSATADIPTPCVGVTRTRDPHDWAGGDAPLCDLGTPPRSGLMWTLDRVATGEIRAPRRGWSATDRCWAQVIGCRGSIASTGFDRAKPSVGATHRECCRQQHVHAHRRFLSRTKDTGPVARGLQPQRV
jgi:hypothetical protein